MELIQLFLHLGWDHILEGYDHILFLIALILLIEDWKKTAWIVTAFTLAHTFSMFLTLIGWISLPSLWVEVAIAVSIFYAGLENVLSGQTNNKWKLAGAFGLVHGLGFSNHLSAILTESMPFPELIQAFFGFVLGLEMGQILVVILLGSTLYLMRTWSRKEAVQQELSRAIAASGLVFAVMRAFEI